MDSSRHAEFGALLIVSNGCIQLNIRAKTCMRCVHTHKYTQCYTNAYVPTHRRRHRKKQLQNGVSDVFCPVVEMCLFLVRVGWDFLENLGFGGFSKENQSFPKFPKVSQSFPKFPKRSRVTFSFEFVLRFHAGWGLFGSLGRWVSKGNPKFPKKIPSGFASPIGSCPVPFAIVLIEGLFDWHVMTVCSNSHSQTCE